MRQGTVDVLLVDDESTALIINRRAVEGAKGFCIRGEATNGEEMFAFLERFPIDLVILDLFMPAMDGVAALRKLRAATHPVDVIVASSGRDRDLVRFGARMGIFAYLVKPYPVERLRAALESYGRFLENALATPQRIDQASADELLESAVVGTLFDDCPKNIHEDTLAAILDELRRSEEPLSANELAERLGFSPSTARRYLLQTVASGCATVELEYRTIGRPIRRYRIH